jgi:hypothetical protein
MACPAWGVASEQSLKTAHGGELVRAVPVLRLTPKGVKQLVGQWREEDNLRLDRSKVRYGVRAYRLVYRTRDAHGNPTIASGLVALPRSGREHLRTVVWEHGTTVYKGDAPSTGSDSDARLVSFVFAGAGFGAIAPDYIGLGVGPGHQPFNDTASEVSSSVDMIRAARTFVAAQGRHLDRHLLVSGFSQGGKVAMALGDAIQSGAINHAKLKALAPVSGVYDIEHAQTPARNHGRLDERGSNFYLAYTAVSWKYLYHLYDDPSEVFLPRYGKSMEQLFNGHHTQGEIFSKLPATPEELFQPDYLALARHPKGVLLHGIRRSDGSCRYQPKVPVRLYAARGDTTVAFTNSLHCRRDVRARGGHPRLINVGQHGHFGSVLLSVPRILHWFKDLPH